MGGDGAENRHDNDADRENPWFIVPEGTISTVIGTIIQRLAGVVIALFYTGILESIGAISGWLTGGIIGLFHALIIGSLVMPMIGTIHPVIRAGKMEAPGFFAINKGQASPIYIIIGHIIFGSVLGAVYLL